MGEGVPITNTLFPPPPAYYKAFTPEALQRYAELNPAAGSSRAGSSSPTKSPTKAPADITPAEPGELEKLERELEPPRADWVREDGRWMLFGQMYTVSMSGEEGNERGVEC